MYKRVDAVFTTLAQKASFVEPLCCVQDTSVTVLRGNTVQHNSDACLNAYNNNNNNNKDDVYCALIMTEPLREFTRFT